MIYKVIKSLLVLTFFIPIVLWVNEILHINIAQAEHFIEKNVEKVQDTVETQYKKIEDNSSSNLIRGIDLSHNNGKVEWDKIEGVDFVIIKATGGDTFIDPMFKTNWNDARGAGIKRAAYHFYYASDDPISQSKNFLDTVGALKEFDLPLVVDVETLDHADKDLLLYGLTRFLEILEKQTKKLPMIYSDLSFYKTNLMDEKLKKYPIWIADYGKSDIKELEKELPNRDIVMWQYTQKGKLSGIDGFVDKSTFYGDLNNFIQKSNIK